MADLILREWNQKRIRIREDRYVCLTDMAQASSKKISHWLSLDSTKSYLNTLSSKAGITALDLVQVKRGGNNSGTWGHPKVALRFAQWCSDEFAIQVDCWIDELITTGSVSLTKANFYTLDDILRRKPAMWERMFTHEWIAEAEKLTRWKWNWQCMSQFINDCVYAYLPAEIVETLRELNPKAEDGRRVHKHHQYLQPEVRERVASHLQDVQTLMNVSNGDIEFFKTLMIRKYGSFKMSGTDDMPLFQAQTVFLLKAAS